MHHCTCGFFLAAVAAYAALNAPVQARIKLVTLPERDATVIRLDNPQATLVEEERVLALQKGVNQIDFSWKGVAIDPDSIRLVALSHPDEVVLLNVSYPPDEAALVWEINSLEAREETVRISYLLSNIDRLVTYKAVADKEETAVNLRGFIILRNFSGEDFAQARVILEEGAPVEQAIGHEETRQIQFLNVPKVPFKKIWKYDAALKPWDPAALDVNVGIPVTYCIVNDQRSGLGQTALWSGKARVFQDDGRQSSIFSGEDAPALVPVGEKMEIYVGDSRDIVVTQRQMRNNPVNIRKDNGANIVLYDTDEVIVAKIENFKDKPATLTMVQHIRGQWEMHKCNLKYERKDAETLEFQIELAPRGRQELNLHYRRLNIRPGREQVSILPQSFSTAPAARQTGGLHQ